MAYTRGMKVRSRLFKIATGIILGLMLAVLLPAAAFAYPAGWTSDGVVISGHVNCVDVASRGNDVWLAYILDSGATPAHVMHSGDKGATWGSPVSLPLTVHDTQGIVITATSTDVFVVAFGTYEGNRGSHYYKSSNGGNFTWYGWDNSGSYPRSITKSGNVPAYCSDSGYCKIGPGQQTPDTSKGGFSSIATDGTYYFNENSNGTGTGFSVARFNVGGGFVSGDSVITGDSTNPVASIGYHSGSFDLVYCIQSGSIYEVRRKSLPGPPYGSWPGGSVELYYSSISMPPKVIPMDGGDAVCSSTYGLGYVRATAATDTGIYTGFSAPIDFAVSCEGGSSDVYLAVLKANNSVALKRTDSSLPASSGVSAGGNSFPEGTYVKDNFSLTFNSVVDQWNYSGTDPYGTQYVGGVQSIDAGWEASQNPGSWSHLFTLSNTPWSGTVNISEMGGDGTYFYHGDLTDTALNRSDPGTVTSGPVIIDTVRPTVDNVVMNPVPAGEGYVNRAVTCTITGHDANLLGCQYSIDGGAWAADSSGAPFTVSSCQGSFRYRSVDKAGNYSDIKSVLLRVDVVAPVVTITTPSGDTLKADRNNNADIGAESTDSSGVEHLSLYWDSQLVAETDSGAQSTQIKNLVGGRHLIEARALDTAGNEGYASKYVNVVTAEEAYSDSFFAEGTTRAGFDEYLCIFNPSKTDSQLIISFMLEDGTVIPYSMNAPANSRITLSVPSVVPRGHDVSVKIHSSGSSVVCERPMYFDYNG